MSIFNGDKYGRHTQAIETYLLEVALCSNHLEEEAKFINTRMSFAKRYQAREEHGAKLILAHAIRNLVHEAITKIVLEQERRSTITGMGQVNRGDVEAKEDKVEELLKEAKKNIDRLKVMSKKAYGYYP